MEFIDLDAPADFQLVPSLAVMGNSPVWVKDGMYNQITMEGRTPPVLGIAGEILERYGRMHYLDILGIRKGDVEWNQVQALAEIKGELWTDTGITISDAIIDPIMAGADRAVVTTKMIESLEEIASCLELTENILVQIDYDKGIVSKDKMIRKMRPEEFMEEMASLGISAFIIVDMEENRKELSKDLLMGVLRSAPEDASVVGGALELDELEVLADSGLDGAVISISRLIEGLD